MGCSQGARARLLVEPGSPSYTFDASSEAYDFNYETVAKNGRLVGGQGISGTRSYYANRVREGSYMVSGRLSTDACQADLDFWLPRALGAAESSDVFDVDDSLATNGPFGMLIDRVGGIFQYDDCMVNRWVLRGAAGPGDQEPEVVEQILEIVGKDETLGTTWPGSPPSIGTGTNRAVYIVADATLTIGSAYNIKEFVLVVDNAIQPRWVNSLTPTELCAQDRVVMLRCTLPFTATEFAAIYQHADAVTGVSASLAIAPSGAQHSTTIALEGLQWAQNSPTVPGKQDIDMPLTFIARKTGSASEIVVTNENAP